ncbi:hypothetical protein DERP_005857 [Dermatophagoides pteronyssinus]|uniref:Uncharacterized protein n=1 Tax=Dermatophagoides pteronyssinus TaxID=6956 RepID=A0ABQ8J9R0_DERPT|nr:hypothetical protein DERP_005857 [Dermatophagoides pteronyssinus]
MNTKTRYDMINLKLFFDDYISTTCACFVKDFNVDSGIMIIYKLTEMNASNLNFISIIHEFWIEMNEIFGKNKQQQQHQCCQQIDMFFYRESDQ